MLLYRSAFRVLQDVWSCAGRCHCLIQTLTTVLQHPVAFPRTPTQSQTQQQTHLLCLLPQLQQVCPAVAGQPQLHQCQAAVAEAHSYRQVTTGVSMHVQVQNKRWCANFMCQPCTKVACSWVACHISEDCTITAALGRSQRATLPVT